MKARAGRRVGAGALAWLGGLPLLCNCAGQQGPPHHPVTELSARATAKVGVVELVVPDPARAEHLRELYLRIAALGHEFDRARARAMLRARTLATERTGEDESSGQAALEHLLAPPLAQSRAAFDRYAQWMLEAKRLLTEDEFERLNRVR